MLDPPDMVGDGIGFGAGGERADLVDLHGGRLPAGQGIRAGLAASGGCGVELVAGRSVAPVSWRGSVPRGGAGPGRGRPG